MAASYSSLNLVLMGPPGSGKSTQARLLAEQYQLPLISTHEMLQSEVEQGTTLGRQVEDGMVRGELISDRLMSGMILQRLDREDCWRGFILDGYPRNSEQAALLDGILAELGRSIERVVVLDVDEEVGVERLISGDSPEVRYEVSDDNGGAGAAVLRSGGNPDQAIRERFRVWRDNAPMLIESYKNRGLLLEIDGRRPKDQVREAVMQAVGAPVGA